ncbi:MAG: Hsp33 family molecular chaperone HslO [Clostridia bacterium]|nr:Hsp33 family molecular chaperone HslO [Clostridia bacterium]MBQ2965246.1 Hsp33 family molecular chaperone HslO [Clostridia bacterium]MBQ6930831.1 Hsp33 family molecular chaperone HslO [Clostridia bacterium]
MGKIIRTITSTGEVMCIAVDATDIVERAQQIHKTSAVTSAALGRLLSAASMMGDMLKGKDDSVTLRISGDGPAGSVIAVADSEGNCRGYVSNPVVEIDLNSKGKLDVSGAIGSGTLTVMKDLNLKEPYVAQIPLVSGEIAEDITAYYATSEQTPTVCALGVLVNPDLSIRAAGGFMIQLLPFASEEAISGVEKSIEGLPSFTQMLSSGMTLEAICKRALQEFEIEILDESEPVYKCYCSKERVEAALISTGKAELEDMAKDEKTEVSCHFCDAVYTFTSKEIIDLSKRC